MDAEGSIIFVADAYKAPFKLACFTWINESRFSLKYKDAAEMVKASASGQRAIFKKKVFVVKLNYLMVKREDIANHQATTSDLSCCFV